MTTPRRILLIGFMSSGKSAIATRLSELLGIPMCQTDDLIIERSGCASVPEIFEQGGEDLFRSLETAVAKELGSFAHGIISTGGGIITREENRAALKTPGTVCVFLRTSFETARERAGDLSTRPLFRDIEKAQALFEQRAPIYASWADLTIDTDGKDIEQVCAEILCRLKEK